MIRRIYEAFSRRDLGTIAEVLHEDAQVDFTRSLSPENAVYPGIEGIELLLKMYWEAFDDISIEPEDFVDGPDGIVALVISRGRGRGSGARVEARGPHLWSFRDGKPARFTLYQEKCDALEAAGLSGQAMSQENVNLIRRIYDAWDRGESAREFIASDVEYVNPPYAVEPGSRRGRKSFAVVRGTYEDFKLEVGRVIDGGDDQVVVLARYSGSGRGSGVPVAGEHGYVWQVRDGVAVRFQWFQSHREALEAAGLSE